MVTRRWLSIANGYVPSSFNWIVPGPLIPTTQGAFDSFEHEHLPRTKYDLTVDERSNKPGEQAFEVRLNDDNVSTTNR